MKHLYAVTDPCYLVEILGEKKALEVWKKYIELKFQFSKEENNSKKRIDECMKEASAYYADNVPFKVLKMGDTGYGDWDNYLSVRNNQSRLLTGYFTADAGQFIVAEITPKQLDELFTLKPHYEGLMARFESELSPEELEVKVDEESFENWNVISIYNKQTGELIAKTDDY